MLQSNKDLIEQFYTSFKNKDYKAMQACYDEDAVFSDEIFKGLDASQVRAMWEMLVARGKDLNIVFSSVTADEFKGSAEWTATYSFSRTGRKVINKINASFIFNNGKIIQHTDHFDFYIWAKQALGLTGILLGRTSYLKQKIRRTAMDNLKKFMQGK